MSPFLDYLENLAGSKTDTLDTSLLDSPFYGIELYVDQPLPAGTYRLVKQVQAGNEEHWVSGEFQAE